LEIKEALERETKSQVLQFEKKEMGLLADDLAFGKHVKELGLNVLEVHLITSETDAVAVLSPK
jgi:hypothetical protein